MDALSASREQLRTFAHEKWYRAGQSIEVKAAGRPRPRAYPNDRVTDGNPGSANVSDSVQQLSTVWM